MLLIVLAEKTVDRLYHVTGSLSSFEIGSAVSFVQQFHRTKCNKVLHVQCAGGNTVVTKAIVVRWPVYTASVALATTHLGSGQCRTCHMSAHHDNLVCGFLVAHLQLLRQSNMLVCQHLTERTPLKYVQADILATLCLHNPRVS